jgi:hypothetical protein
MALDFLTEEKGASTMRICVFLITIAVFNVLNSIAFALCVSAWRGTIDTFPLSEMAVFVTGLTAIETAVLWNKVAQKRVEVEAEKTEAET